MNKIVTHGTSNFHTDDVFAVAVLDILLKGDIEAIRTLDKDVIDSADFVVDIGRVYDPEKNRFDHHQEGGAGKRENGIEYAAVGLVWKHFGEKICGSQEIADIVDARLIQPIDAGDNGQDLFDLKTEVKPYLLHDVVSAYRNDDDNSDEDLRSFLEVEKIAKVILQKEIKSAKNFISSKKETLDAYNNSENKQIIVFDNEDYSDDARMLVLSDFQEPLYIVRPDKDRGSWRIKAIRKSKHGFANRKDLPKEWAGLTEKDLQDVSGVPDAMFCHRALFTASVLSKEGALAMAQKALEN